MTREKPGRDPGRRRKNFSDLLRNRHGNIAVMFALAATPLLGAAGVGIDGVLAFLVQGHLQAAADSAALAAAKVMISGNPSAEAERLLRANFPPGYLGADLAPAKVFIDEDGDDLTVKAEATLPTRFMGLFGKDSVEIGVSSVVHRANRASEIVLVMDNTGSMDSGNKMPVMKAAARELVNNLYGQDETKENLVVGVVPYVASVNIGPEHEEWLAPTDRVRVDPNAFAPTEWKGCVMGRSEGHDQDDATPSEAPFTSYFYEASTIDNDWGPEGVKEEQYFKNNGTGPNLGCGPAILPLVPEKSKVLSAIDEMQPWHRGGTLGSLGLVWGWRVISPKWRGLWEETPAEHPVDYRTERTDKIVVMLTDGDNQLHDWLNDKKPRGSDFSAYGRLYDFGYANLGGARDEVDRRMADICEKMKDEGIVIYTITFGPAPKSGTQELYRECASRSSNYFHAPTNEILASAFKEIGDRLSELRVVR